MAELQAMLQTHDPDSAVLGMPSGAVPPPPPSRGTTTPAPPPRPPEDAWRALAACHGMDADVFFPAKGPGFSTERATAEARSVCAACPVRTDCLAAHLHERHGVFGGTSPDQRVALRRLARERAAAHG